MKKPPSSDGGFLYGNIVQENIQENKITSSKE